MEDIRPGPLDQSETTAVAWAHIEVSEALACTVMRIYEVNASTAYHLQGGTKHKK